MIKFRGQIIKLGNSYGIIVPKAFIDNDMIKTGKEYTFEVNENE